MKVMLCSGRLVPVRALSHHCGSGSCAAPGRDRVHSSHQSRQAGGRQRAAARVRLDRPQYAIASELLEHKGGVAGH